MDPVPLKIGSHVYFPAFFHRCKNAYVGRVIAFVKNFVTKVGVKSQLRFTPDSIENDVWLQASVLSPEGRLRPAYQLYHKVKLSVVSDPRCIIAEVVYSEVRNFDPQKFLNLKEVLWKPILEELRAQQAKEEELRVKLLAEMTLPIYRMRAPEVWEEIKHRLAIEERRQVTAALATLPFTIPLDLPLNYNLKTGKILLKSLRENDVLLHNNQ